MKGILKKTEEGWFVIYDQRTMQDPSAEEGILPLHPEDQCILPLDLDLNGKEVEFEINIYDGKSHISNAWNGYAKLIDKSDRSCDHTNCREVCPECIPYPVLDDCEEVKNWDSFVEKKNKELYYQKQVMNPYPTTKHLYTAWEKGFIEGFNKAKELFKEELSQAYIDGKRNGMDISHPLSMIKDISFDNWYNDNYKTENGEGTSQPSNF